MKFGNKYDLHSLKINLNIINLFFRIMDFNLMNDLSIIKHFDNIFFYSI